MLVATDIAARGIHVDDIALVVHVDPPAEHKAYLHRSGRTARAGASGAVVTVVTPDQVRDVRSLLHQAGIRPAMSHVVPGDPRTAALSGPPAERRPPAAVASAARPARKTATDRAPVSTVRRSTGRRGGPSNYVKSVGRKRARSGSRSALTATGAHEVR